MPAVPAPQGSGVSLGDILHTNLERSYVAYPIGIMGLEPLIFEAITLPAALARARPAQLGRQVQPQRAIGCETGVRNGCQVFDVTGIQAPSAALIGAAGVGETIAQHPFAARQRGLDALRHVCGTCGEHQQQFGGRRHPAFAARQRYGADLFGQGSAAGLARRADAPALLFHTLRR